MESLKYYVLDVFTNERFKGNPLAVVVTDTELDMSAYEKISREFGYSETSFIYYSKAHKALKVRSFTPTGFEVDGAGHNLLGAVNAALLIGMDIFWEQGTERFVIMRDQTIQLLVDHNTETPIIGMLQQPAIIQTRVDAAIIAKALTLEQTDVLTGDLLPAVVKTEVAHLMVSVKSLEVLNHAAPVKSLLIKLASEYKFEGVYCFTMLEQNSEYFAQTRFFNPGIGIDEDPATGSAAGPLAGFLFDNRLIQKDISYKLLQGVKMNQPSIIQLVVKAEGIWISGSSIIVMEGVLYL
jgi:trans-2,3-dihydro-3-hydroxyanthranilate isomerase